MARARAAKFVLERDNYYSLEADRHYYSCSQIDGFRDCEARTMAVLRGEWVEEKGTPFLVGQYFHAAMEGEDAYNAFCEEHFHEIYKTKGGTKTTPVVTITGKYAPYAQADLMIEATMADPMYASLMRFKGENEVAMSGLLFGKYPFKVRFDRYITKPQRAIVDWKTTAGIWETLYNEAERERQPFIRYYGYIMRAAVYTEIERQNANANHDAAFYLFAVSKQDVPETAVISLSDDFARQEMDGALGGTDAFGEPNGLYADMVRIDRVKRGMTAPLRCGRCEYCRSTKKNGGPRILSIADLDPGTRPGREEEYGWEAGWWGLSAEIDTAIKTEEAADRKRKKPARRKRTKKNAQP